MGGSLVIYRVQLLQNDDGLLISVPTTHHQLGCAYSLDKCCEFLKSNMPRVLKNCFTVAPKYTNNGTNRGNEGKISGFFYKLTLEGKALTTPLTPSAIPILEKWRRSQVKCLASTSVQFVVW